MQPLSTLRVYYIQKERKIQPLTRFHAVLAI
jgi:hypothetical protein